VRLHEHEVVHAALRRLASRTPGRLEQAIGVRIDADEQRLRTRAREPIRQRRITGTDVDVDVGKRRELRSESTVDEAVDAAGGRDAHRRKIAHARRRALTRRSRT
jgi:hypothetical protein